LLALRANVLPSVAKNRPIGAGLAQLISPKLNEASRVYLTGAFREIGVGNQSKKWDKTALGEKPYEDKARFAHFQFRKDSWRLDTQAIHCRPESFGRVADLDIMLPEFWSAAEKIRDRAALVR
jgi:hypothetical protein